MYVDNQAVIAMVNENKPTNRAHHIDIQHFAVQEWRARKEIILRHVPGVINSSDALTKAVGWVLHKRHSLQGMGHYGPSDAIPRSPKEAMRLATQVAGEGVRSSNPRPGDSQVEQDWTGLDKSQMDSLREILSSRSEMVKAPTEIQESDTIPGNGEGARERI